MNSAALVQWSIIAVLVAASALYTLGRLFPRWRNEIGAYLQRDRFPRWVGRVGRGIGGSAGCGSGCNTCGSCAETARKPAAQQ